MSVLHKTHELTQIEWKVVDIFVDAEDENFKCFVSPTFSFADATWRLLLAGKFMSNPESTSLILMRNEHRNCSLEYTFGMKKYDGTIELLDRGVMKDDQKRSEHRFIKLSEVLRQKAELAPNGIVTIMCTLKLEAVNKDPSMNEPKRKKLKKPDVLAQNLKNLFKSKVCCDVILQVKDKEFRAHKAVLIARSRVFAAMFQHETSEKQSGVIKIPDCDPESFAEFLEYMYCGNLDEVSTRNALHLFETSEKYNIPELKDFCCEILIDNLSVENWYDVIVLADLYNEDDLFSAAQDFFNKNQNKIFQTAEWEHLMKTNYALPLRLLREMPNVKLDE